MTQNAYFESGPANGLTTINITSDTVRLMDGYYPAAGAGDNEAVIETMEVLLTGSSEAGLWVTARAIAAVFSHARDHSDDDQGAWFYYTPATAASAWRARILDGRVQADGNLIRRLGRLKLKLFITMKRAPYFEGALVDLPLTNPNGAGVTSGLRVYNGNDGTGTAPTKVCNYADILGPLIEGDLPAPLNLEMVGVLETGDNNMRDLMVGLNTYGGLTPIHSTEHETMDPPSVPYYPTVALAGRSGGAYTRKVMLSATAKDYPNSTVTLWLLDAVNNVGNYARVMARVSANNAGPYFLQAAINGNQYYAPVVQVSFPTTGANGFQWVSLATIPVPFRKVNTSAPLIAHVGVHNWGPIGSELWIDDMLLLPLEGYRRYPGVVQNVLDCQVDNFLYATYTLDVPQVSPDGVLAVVPGRTNRLVFAWNGYPIATRPSKPAQPLTLKARYRPRRSAL